MKKFLLTLIAVSTAGFTQAEPVAIFNGKDYTGWHGNNPHTTSKAKDDAARAESLKAQQKEFTEHWTVKDGVMVNDGHGPYATSDKEYGDMEFWLDYKTVALADSGIYLRGAPQIQIWDHTNEKAFKHGADKGSGALWNNSPDNPGKMPLVLADKPFGEWNSVHVKMVGSRTWVWLNDKLVVKGAVFENYWDRSRKTPLPDKGPIHLQTHGGEIQWRNIKVHEYTAAEATAILREGEEKEGFNSIFNGTDLSGWAGPLENYEVVDGAIGCKAGKGGTLYHDDELTDFVARVEFKLPPGGNNGLAIRYNGKGNPAYDAMTELQVLDNTAEKYAKLDERQFHGGAYGVAAAHRGHLRPLGEWNYQEVTVKGSTIKVELNGSIILETDVSKVTEFMADKKHPGLNNASGFFGFAGHNDPVLFRNISIKKL